jgi:4-amino-4-deoxy-L-arabinose transferase-like glycosyltransferase
MVNDALHHPRVWRDEWRVLLCWTLVAFALRLLLVWRVEQVISPDGVLYVTLGQKLVAGNLREGLSTYWTPLYPLLVGLSSLVFGDAELAGQLVSVAAGSILVIPVYALIHKWYGGRVALVGACLVALHPVLVYYSTVLLIEATYTLIFTCGILAGWSALSGGRARAYAAAGAAFGACYLLKPEAVGFLFLLLALLLFRKLFDRAHTLRLAARDALLLCAGFLLLAAPYLFYLRQQTGKWIISGKTAGHLLQGSRRAGGELATLVPSLISEVTPGTTHALVQLTKALRFEYELFHLLFPVVFVMLAALGLFRERWTRERAWREAYLFSFVAATLAGYIVTLPNVRFLVPLVPLMLCWVSKGVVEFEGWAKGTMESFQGTRGSSARGAKLFMPLAVGVLLASLLPVFVYLLRGDKWGDYYGQKLAAIWIREHDAASVPVIMSTVPVAPFYARGRHVVIADEDYAGLISLARREGASHVIVNERDFRHMRLRQLLEEEAPHPGLRLAHSLSEAPGHRVLVYAVEGTVDERAAPQEVRAP